MRHEVKKAFVLFSVLLFASGAVFAQSKTALPDPGITPESRFYFVDKLGEFLREFFTFSSEGKARLQITFAAERVAEIKIILEEKGVEAKGLAVAQSRLQAHLARAAGIVADEKAEGNDARRLAQELDDEFEGPKSALEEAFRAKKQVFENQEDELKVKIRDARRTGNTAEVEAWVKQLAEAKAQKELLEQEEGDQEESLKADEERIEEEMGAQAESEKKIRKAEKEKQKILDEAAAEGISLPPETFATFDEHISEAKSAFAAGKFEEAKHHAEKAKESLEKVDDAIGDFEKVKEEEEELNEEREEKTKEEAEHLKEETKKIQEKSRQAEKKLREAGKIEEEEEEEETKHDEGSDSSSAQNPRVEIVTIRAGRFDDDAIDIRRGDTVRWINRDSQPHWPASNPHPMHTNLPGLDTLKQLDPGESYEFTFTQSGAFGYHDHLNPSVTGQIIVK